MTEAEPLPSKTSLNVSELRSRVLIGQLPNDFLRLSVPSNSSESGITQAQHSAAIAQQQRYYDPEMTPAEHFYYFIPPHTRGRIAVKIVEAKLTKNYGLPGVRMDPYIRLRIGNTLFETPTSVNGGKTPSWNRTVNAYLPDGVESIYIQIYDERAFTQDECVAWAHVILPEGIFNNEVIDEWYQLSGPQGEGKEGVINLVMSFSPIQQQQQPNQPAQEQAVIEATEAVFTEQEVTDLAEMFPAVDKEVIRSVLEMKRGDKDSTVTALIEMSS
jgi:toll-interacting protein